MAARAVSRSSTSQSQPWPSPRFLRSSRFCKQRGSEGLINVSITPRFLANLAQGAENWVQHWQLASLLTLTRLDQAGYKDDPVIA